jgi:hypothetical protein
VHWSRKESLGSGNPGAQRSGADGKVFYGPDWRKKNERKEIDEGLAKPGEKKEKKKG